MRIFPKRWLQGTSLRTRVLTMALVPSIALLLAGVLLAGYLIYNAVQVRAVMTDLDEATPEGRAFFQAVRQERGLTLREIAHPQTPNAALNKARATLDEAADELFKALRPVAEDAPQGMRAAIARDKKNVARLDEVRARVDSGQMPLEEAYRYYNDLMHEVAYGLTALAKGFDDAEITYLRLEAMPLFRAADAMARAHALALAALSSGGLTEEQFRIFSAAVGTYHSRLQTTVPSMIPEVKSAYVKLKKSQAWQTVVAVEHAILRGPQSDLPVTPQQWRAAVAKTGKVLGNLYVTQSDHATQLSLRRSKDQLIFSIVTGAAAVLFAAVVLLLALRMSNRLVRRLTQLRGQTLEIAEDRLPRLVQDVRAGQPVDTDTDDLRIDQGRDEIGQVGDAFNKAQQTAIEAAVEEARTREGTKTVFLNIAHRSQVIVHRQLKALDQAERKQEDPDQLDMLFQLDHLSTRARRNAENLIILGGQQPGRQWRNPVAVTDLARGAIAETEDYARVTVGKLPEVAVQGGAVGDIVHLLAELVDNATAFSPPESRVELRGNVVGRGVVLEVEDQGLGIEQEQRDEFNAMMADPPEFSVMTLSEEPRLGLFVVARLAARHGVSVTLRDSAYGGTRAIVLIRTDLIHSGTLEPDEGPAEQEQAPVGEAPAPEPTPESEPPRRQPPERAAPTDGRPALPVRRAPSRAAPGRAPVDATVPDMPTSAATTPTGGSNGARDVGTDGKHHWPDPQQTQRHENGRPAAPSPAPPPSPPPSPPPRQQGQRTPPPPAERGAPATMGAAAAPQGRNNGSPAGQAGLSPGRPSLPQRRRQQHIAPQLREADEAPRQAPSAAAEPEEVTADTAKHRLSAFQRGTRQAREQEEGS